MITDNPNPLYNNLNMINKLFAGTAPHSTLAIRRREPKKVTYNLKKLPGRRCLMLVNGKQLAKRRRALPLRFSQQHAYAILSSGASRLFDRSDSRKPLLQENACTLISSLSRKRSLN